MLPDFILFAVGFYILIKGAQILVNGASAVAQFLRVSPWVIGAVIVGIGTSIPEFSVSIASAFKGTDVGFATITGSNTFNILAILGFSALLMPITLRREWITRDLMVNVLAIVASFLLLAFPVAGDPAFYGITRDEGLILLAIFLVWLWHTVRNGREAHEPSIGEKTLTLSTSFMMIAGGLIGVIFGGQWVVDGAVEIAKILGASDAFIGLTLISIGTSIPELVVTVVAALERRPGIAVGNIIGSNIFDFLGILGPTALLHPIAVASSLAVDTIVTVGASLVLLTAALTSRPYSLSRREGVVMLFLYVLYLIFLVIRG